MTDSALKVGLGITEIIGDNRAEILILAEKYKAHNIRIFGSVAHGEATVNSDIDFLVNFESGYTLLDHAGLLVALRDLLGRGVDVIREALIREEYTDDILHDVLSV